MKLIGIILAALLMLSGCDKEELKELLPEMTATIDGTEWESLTRVTVEEGNKFIITGTSLSGKTLVITIFGNTEGVYELNKTSVKCSAVYKESDKADAKDTFIAISGTVNLSEVNTSKKTLSGTFSFTMLKGLSTTLNITNGEFLRIKYTVSS